MYIQRSSFSSVGSRDERKFSRAGALGIVKLRRDWLCLAPMTEMTNRSDRHATRAVILAGGKGTRLAPYTTVLPKPLLPIGNRAILEVVVEQLRSADFTDLTVAIGYLGHLIEAVLKDGSDYGVSIEYHREKEPLGTAGPLGDIEGLDEPFLMMNGDVLTTLDYGDLYRAHCEAGNVLTIATHRRLEQSDYGILELDGANGDSHRVIGYNEKPESIYTVSMGVYLIDPMALDYIPRAGPMDFPELVVELINAGLTVGSYLYEGLWLDIGRHDDYLQAAVEYEKLASLAVSDAAM
jgi:NDP-mannose synthase